MRFLIILGAAVASAISYRLFQPLELQGLARLSYPVLFRDDEGSIWEIYRETDFLKKFEIQDLYDDHFQGWDSLGRPFHFVLEGRDVKPVLGEPEWDWLEFAINRYRNRALPAGAPTWTLERWWLEHRGTPWPKRS